MFEKLRDAIRPSRAASLGRAFSRLGWVGFWLQVVLGPLPIIVMVYYFFFSQSGTASPSGFAFVGYATIVDLLILLFTLCWSYRYTRLGKQIRDPERCPPASSVVGIVWVGVLASTVGLLLSMIILVIEAANVLFIFLRAPQGGIPMVQTGAEAPYWVSSVDMVSMMASILVLFAEVLVLMFSLWLLFRSSMGSPEYPQPADGTPSEAKPGSGSAAAPPAGEVALPRSPAPEVAPGAAER
jgi:hypothetical protein